MSAIKLQFVKYLLEKNKFWYRKCIKESLTRLLRNGENEREKSIGPWQSGPPSQVVKAVLPEQDAPLPPSLPWDGGNGGAEPVETPTIGRLETQVASYPCDLEGLPTDWKDHNWLGLKRSRPPGRPSQVNQGEIGRVGVCPDTHLLGR